MTFPQAQQLLVYRNSWLQRRHHVERIKPCVKRIQQLKLQYRKPTASKTGQRAPEPRTLGLNLHIAAKHDCVTALPEIHEKVHPDPGSSHCTALARSWFTACVDNHAHACTTSRSFASDSIIRFLDVDHNATELLLVEFPPNEAPSGWVALSYR